MNIHWESLRESNSKKTNYNTEYGYQIYSLIWFSTSSVHVHINEVDHSCSIIRRDGEGENLKITELGN